MLTTFNHSFLNSSLADIYVVPAESRHLDDPNFNMTKLNFTWVVDSYELDTLDIKIVWECASCLSPLSV